jgi:hypothetical protein
MVFRNKDMLCYREIYVEDDEPITFFHCDYYRLSEADNETALKGENRDIKNVIEDVKTVVGVILLPKLEGDRYMEKNKNTLYCIVRSDWT